VVHRRSHEADGSQHRQDDRGRKEKEAKSHLKMSEDAMKAKDTAGCVKHMEEAHKAMGL
jgi:hypothetical protein